MGYIAYVPGNNEEKLFQELLKGQQIGFGYGFVGTPFQRGAGLGSIFASLFRAIAPMAKSAAKAVGRRALNAGLDVASDLVAGQNVKETLKTRGKKLGSEIIQDAQSAVQKKRKQSGRGLGNRGKRKKEVSIFDKKK